jgi:hypothetical protein
MIGGGRPGRSVGKPTTGASTGMNNGMNVAETLVSAFIVTVQPPIPPHAPPQPARPQARSGVAVSTTWVPALKLALQFAPQSISEDELVTLLPGAPTTVTERV